MTDTALADTLTADLVRMANLPGISVAAYANGRVMYANGAGYRDIAHQLPVESSTVYGSGSVAKVVTATAALRLIQAGRFDPDETVAQRLPHFPGGREITARQLAAHLGGIPHYGPRSMPSGAQHGWASHALGEFADAPRVGEPGERSVYSTHGLTLLSAMMEQAEQRPILDILQREVFAPFAMTDSGGLFVDALPPNFVTMYERAGSAWRARSGPRNLSFSWAGAGLRHTPTDLVRMAQPYFDGTFHEATLRLAFDEQHTRAGEATGLGFVWRLERDWRGRALAHHAGATAGTRAVLLLRREQQQAVAVMTNLDWAASPDRTANMFAEALFDSAPRHSPLHVEGHWSGTLEHDTVSGTWSVQGDHGWISVPASLQARFARAGGITSERLTLRAIRDDLYALVTPWGLYPFEVERDAAGEPEARVHIGTQWWSIVPEPQGSGD